MSRKLLSLYSVLIMLCLLPLAAFGQQTGTVRGKVTEASTGEALPGANIFIQELNKGATSNADGLYTINNVQPGTYTFVISFIGYKKQTQVKTVEAGVQTFNFQLETETMGLGDVVVTAQQIERQERELGYSVSSVKGEDINKAKENNVVNSLSGKIAGVSITNQSGNLGGSSRIVIRGITSLSGDNQPLFVVDGVPISNSNIVANTNQTRLNGSIDVGNRAQDINANDIESISVLKGAAAAALYGQRAKNGVILITTKSGKGNPNGTASFSSSVESGGPLKLPEFQNIYAQGSLGKYNVDNLNGWGPVIKGQKVKNYEGKDITLTAAPNNLSNFYENSLRAINSISFANSTANSDFRLGVTRADENGIVPNSNMDRTNISINAGSKFSDQFRVRLGGNYINSSISGKAVQGGNNPNVLTSLINTLPRTFSMDNLENYTKEDGSQRPIDNFTNNPYWIVNKNVYSEDLERIIGHANVIYDPFDWLNITGRAGTDFYTQQRQQKTAQGTIGRETGAYSSDIIRENQLNTDLMATIKRDITEDFNIKALIGHNINIRKNQIQNNQSTDLTVDGLYSFSNAQNNTPSNHYEERRLVGVYGDVTLGYDNYLFLELTGRNDWSSTLPKNNNSFFYPSANLSFIFTEGLHIDSDILSFGKLRMNYAQVGSDEAPYQLNFRYFPVSDIFGQYGTGVTFPFGGLTGFEATGTIPPRNLKPQRQISYEIGTELQFFEGRLGLDVTVYDTRTQDQIISIPIPQSTGYGFRRTNIGEVSNKGIEALLTATPVQSKNFQWNFSTNFTKNKNKVVSLAPGVDEIVIQSGYNSLQVKAEPGKALGLYGPGFARDPETGKVIIDENTGLRQAGEIKRLGGTDPDFKLGFDNTFNYKNLSLSFLIDWSQGGVLFSNTVGALRRAGVAKETAVNRDGTFIDDGVNVTRDASGNIVSRKPNQTPVSSMQAFWNRYADAGIHEGNTFSATYVKLREVSLSYTFPTRWFTNAPIRNASLALSGRNLFLLYSEIPHIDPETGLFGSASNGQGIEWNVLPSVRTFGATLKFNI